MGIGKSVAMEEKETKLWQEVKGKLDAACADSIYASDPQFRVWFEIVAYWDFTNGACDYDYKIVEGEEDHHVEYKLSMLENEHGPFEKLWEWVTTVAEITFSQPGRLRCKNDGTEWEKVPNFFDYYDHFDRETSTWGDDLAEQGFNNFLRDHPIDHIPLSIQHYKDKGAIMWETDSALTDVLMAY